MLKRIQKQKDNHGSIAVPIYEGAAFEFDSAEEMEEAFLGKSGKHTYSRISNPTVEAFELNIQQISGAKNVLAVSSGMAAISNVFMTLASSGSNIVTSPHLFGNTFSLFLFTLKAFGVEVRFCNLLDEEEVKSRIDDKTCAVFTEIITNPHMEVVDLQSLASIAHSKNVPFIVDSTIVPWPEFCASNFDIDIEVVSSTKYLSGGGTTIGGLILDHENFDWSKSLRLQELAKSKGPKAFIHKLRAEIIRNTGAYMSPHTAYMQNLGLETLSLRFQKSSGTCKQLAEYLETVPGIVSVNYTGLVDNPFYTISRKQFGDRPGSMLTFCMKDKEACYAFINKLKIIKRATNLFDNCSLIIHPLSTIYGPLADEYKRMVDVPDNLLRLSVGLEDFEELKNDILQAL
ncbi:MAG: aminotransferase class V-fold PLP-dependent enzyme [Bacteroidales bacterium]|nr:aminotransferase class V-fold PLP-dependent enzyme [Bacteroidales bacterium]